MGDSIRSEGTPQKLIDQYESEENAEKERERWRMHQQYRSNKKPQLEVICRQLKIPVTLCVPKFQLVKLIVEKRKEPPPPEPKLIMATYPQFPLL